MRVDRPATTSDVPVPGEDWTVVWTRGESNAAVADLLAPGRVSKADSDLKAAVVQNRANVLVTHRAGSFDFAATVVPQGFDTSRAIGAVVGAIGTGPHSEFVAETTRRLAAGLGVDPLLVTMAREESDGEPEELLDSVADLVPHSITKAIQAETAAEFIERLPQDAPIVLGAPGGSWWQRQFFGPGRRLLHAAPAGALVVRVGPRRCFHALESLDGIGAPMRAADAAVVLDQPVAPVLADGVVIGLVRRAAAKRRPDATVEAIMEPPVMVEATEPIDAAIEVADHFDGAPVPIVDESGRLIGGVPVTGV